MVATWSREMNRWIGLAKTGIWPCLSSGQTEFFSDILFLTFSRTTKLKSAKKYKGVFRYEKIRKIIFMTKHCVGVHETLLESQMADAVVVRTTEMSSVFTDGDFGNRSLILFRMQGRGHCSYTQNTNSNARLDNDFDICQPIAQILETGCVPRNRKPIPSNGKNRKIMQSNVRNN